jgi:hypothetical protein
MIPAMMLYAWAKLKELIYKLDLKLAAIRSNSKKLWTTFMRLIEKAMGGARAGLF